jgi:hypothetical protein
MTSSGSTEELSAYIREQLLSAPPSRVTREVETWATDNGVDATAGDLLERYRDAYEQRRTSLLAELRGQTGDGAGRLVLIGLLNRTAVSDVERLFTLDVLEGTITRSDVSPIASTLIKQRSGVARRAAEILAQVPSGETFFALNKILGRRPDEAGDSARRLAKQLDEANEPVDERDALFYELASPDNEKNPSSPQLTSGLSSAARELDGELQESGRTAQGLSDYQQIVRDELHLLALRAGIPVGDELGDRARDTLFTRTPLDRVREVAPLLPTDVLTHYCQRSLSRIQRRGKRTDRAELALELLATSPEEVRRACSVELRECLAEDAIDLRFGAARALAQDPADLRAEDRSAIAEVYAGLPAEWQERLAPDLTRVLPDDVVLDVAALNRWLLGAKDDEIFDRYQAGLERWKKTAAIDAPGVAALSATLLALAEKLPQEERGAARSKIAEQVSDWLAMARAETHDAISTLLEGGGVADLISEQFWKSSLSRLAPTAVSVLLPAVIDASSTPEETLAGLVSDVPGAHEGFRSALNALLAQGLDLDQVFEVAGPSGQAELLLARLRVTRTLAADERRLAAARDEATTEALVASRETVLSALEAADEASAGNERLQRHFAAIRRAIGFVTESPIAAPPGPAVLEWRTRAADRFSGVVTATDPAQPITVNAAGQESLRDLLRLIDELDRRSHSRGVTTAADREHHLADLQSLVRGILEQSDNEVPPGLAQLAARRPELARLVWTAALGAGGDTRAALARAITDQTDPRRSLLQIDILLEQASDEDLIEVVGELSPKDVAAAWPKTGSLYAHRSRARAAVAADVERQSEQVMERIAAELDLPFQAIESILFGYFRLRAMLRDAGWGQVAESVGDIVLRDDLDLERYEVGDAESSDRFVVRSLGISVRGRPVRRAIVDPIATHQDEGRSIERDQ